MELSEAAPLADIFVFRLMFRLYNLPRAPERGANAETFYQKKRLLAAHAARRTPKKLMLAGKVVEGTSYLMISALTLDTAPGACSALTGGRCSIHDRRPLTCRTVPFHYARADGLALSDFDAFVATPGYRCDSGESAELVLQGGRIVHAATLQARSEALARAASDRPWKEAIARRMKTSGDSLPSLRDIEANAGFAAVTTSMRVGWQIAADAGLLSRAACRMLIERQSATIARELAPRETKDSDRPDAADRQTLVDMKLEYEMLDKRAS
jgi:Fe-S-cluster containining protein